jgi:hypothetical protein
MDNWGEGDPSVARRQSRSANSSLPASHRFGSLLPREPWFRRLQDEKPPPPIPSRVAKVSSSIVAQVSTKIHYAFPPLNLQEKNHCPGRTVSDLHISLGENSVRPTHFTIGLSDLRDFGGMPFDSAVQIIVTSRDSSDMREPHRPSATTLQASPTTFGCVLQGDAESM